MDDVAQIARFLQTHKVRVTTTPPPFEPRVSDDTHLRRWNVCVQWIHSAVKHFSGRNTEDRDASDAFSDDDTVHRALCLFGRLVRIEGLLAKPELNGSEGRCMVYDRQRGRLGVLIDGLPKPLAVKPANLALVSPFFLWGTSMVAMKGVLPVTSPMFVASVRLIPSGLILVAWALSKGRPMPKTATAWGAVAAFAVVDAAMFQGFLAEGLQRTSAGLGSVIIDSQPLTVAILASIFFGETLGVEGVAGLALGVLGLLLLELPEDALKSVVNSDGADALSALRLEGSLWDSGEWWMLLAAQSMAVGTVMVRWVCKYVDPVMATGWHMALGGVPLLAYSLATEPELYSHLSLSGADVASLLYASVFGGAVAYGAFFYFATKGSLTKLSSLTFLTPMFAAALGYLTLDETLSATQLGGAAVTLVGIYFVNTRAKEASAE